jgi:hypothetical protein
VREMREKKRKKREKRGGGAARGIRRMEGIR